MTNDLQPQRQSPTDAAPTQQTSQILRILSWIAPIYLSTFLLLYLASTPIVVRAELALGRGEFREAVRLATEHLKADPNSARALAVAGTACLELRDVSAASAYFNRIGDQDPKISILALQALCRMSVNSGHAVVAERLIRQSLEMSPNDSVGRDLLIYLMTLEGRGWDLRPVVLEQIRAGVINENYLHSIATLHPSLDSSFDYAQHCLAKVPGEPLPKLVLAKRALRDNQSAEVRRFLEQVIAAHGGLLEARALYLRLLAETGTIEEFETAFARLPESTSPHPDIWLSRGIHAERIGQIKAAARCYWEGVRLEPSYAENNYRLSQVLVTLGEEELARPFAERAQKLSRLSQELSLLTSQLNLNLLPSIVAQLEDLGRIWEAMGWCHVALQNSDAAHDWADAMQHRLYLRLWNCTTFTEPTRDPSQQIDLSNYDLPEFNRSGTSNATKHQGSVTPVPQRISFTDDADAVGLSFAYENGAIQGDYESMLEMDGGGVAAFDYDLDDWPDLFFTQGGMLPRAPFEAFDSIYSDKLYRSRAVVNPATTRNRKFEDVSENAGIRDVGYGQGVTAADFDNDGFPDLYVANIGSNQLYHNNGDGTFTDVTNISGTIAGGWSTSCVFADLNRDSVPDLYVVTYLEGDTPKKPCNKRIRPQCGPTMYPAEPDRFYLGLGDGRFRDLTNSCGLAAAEGRGLGVIAADFDHSGHLSLFVANDMSANFFFQNRTKTTEHPLFEEIALLNGLAFDRDGRAKACMGVAAGDYNADGRLDLFVTNFYRQSNDLYVQQPDKTFRDLSREANLFDASFLQLGWGTQFIDADLDGNPDLIVVNGHVHDPLDPEIPFKMPPQFFRNLGNQTFTELTSENLGSFFGQKSLGRSMARLDWNRDGLDDVCISYLDRPVALVTNRTDPHGHYFGLKLIATESARDAIGTRIMISAGGTTRFCQLTGGDGYQASNERHINLGTSEFKKVDVLEVIWPSGTRQQFSNLETNCNWLLIEHQLPIIRANSN